MGRPEAGAEVVGATYRSAVAEARLRRLQEELYAHLASDTAGRCMVCRQAEPCFGRAELTTAILGYGALPRRRPGLTKAGLRRRGIR
jgi:hypothetical protein